MVWDACWNDVFKENEWGKYPPEELIRFIARKFYGVKNRSDVFILEIGCGPGANLWYLSREGFSTYGIDGSEIAIQRARSQLLKEELTVDLSIGDIMSLPYPDSFFDAVIDIECLYANSMEDSKTIISEVQRVLKNDGVFFSKTFMTGTYGEGLGPILDGEPNTYTKLTESALGEANYGLVRFTSEQDILELYGLFKICCVDYIIRSCNNRKYEIREWIIECENG